MAARFAGRRVAVTGMAGISPIGSDWNTVAANLRAGSTGIRRMEGWEEFSGLNSHLGAPAIGFETPVHYPRKMRRAMGRVSLLAVRASEMALEQAGLTDDAVLKGGRMGVSYGSSAGSAESGPLAFPIQ